MQIELYQSDIPFHGNLKLPFPVQKT